MVCYQYQYYKPQCLNGGFRWRKIKEKKKKKRPVIRKAEGKKENGDTGGGR